MSTKYPGGFVTKSPVAPTSSAASGIWTVEQAFQYVSAGTWPPAPTPYIDDYFQPTLYSGTSANQTITTNIDVFGKGGLVWIKRRDASENHALYDTTRGVGNSLSSNTTSAQAAITGVSNFGSTGFSLTGSNTMTNVTGGQYVAWTYAQRPKFFQTLQYTGTGANQTIAHSLGSTPGMIIVKDINSATSWYGYFVGAPSGAGQYIRINSSGGVTTDSTIWQNTTPTSSVFYVGASNLSNESGKTYVAYLFANNGGGFGTSGSENAITCGTVFINSTNPITVNLGYEPQAALLFPISTSDAQYGIFDTMRGMPGWVNSSVSQANRLAWSTANADSAGYDYAMYATSTGLQVEASGYNAGYTFGYIAIRKPMNPPTVATSVFSPIASSAAATTSLAVGFAADSTWVKNRAGLADAWWLADRLRMYPNNYDSSQSSLSYFPLLTSTSTAAEVRNQYPVVYKVFNTTELTGAYYGGSSAIYYNFRRTPGFFDEVCYLGTGAATTQTHNLGVAPELMIVKVRSTINDWVVYSSTLGANKMLYLSDTFGAMTSTLVWNNTAPTSSVFSVGNFSRSNEASQTYVAYLFATLAGISKVGTYTGTGATQTINCGFTGGARFVLIKRTDVDGHGWFVWDTARGMTAGTDPYLLLNSTAIEVNANNCYTIATGFQLVSSLAGINASGGTYIFLAIA